MQGRVRILILIALIIVVGAIAVVFLIGQQEDPPPATQVASNTSGSNTQQTEPDVLTPTPFPTAELVDIVVAIQQISRGSVIPPNAVRLQPWPLEAAPFNAVSSLEDVIGRRARTDIFVEQPILVSMVVDNLSDLAATGSDAAAIIPNGLVGIAVPMDRLTSIAYAVQPGDRVDIIVSFLFVDIDEEFQSLLPNNISIINPQFDESGSFKLVIGESLPGRIEQIRIPVTTNQGGVAQVFQQDQPVLVAPEETFRPRLVTQRTIQDALIIHVGDFPAEGRLFEEIPTPTPERAEEQPQVQQQQAAAPIPTEISRPNIVTIAVTPQDAVIIAWLVEAGIPLSFTLRSAADTSRVPTDPVTLDYIMAQYDITVPIKREFSIEPAIRSIRQLITDDVTSN